MKRSMKSAIYEGRIRHRRFEPVTREFVYRIFMLYLDLDEAPEVMKIHPLWSNRPRSPARLKRSDYLGPADLPLKEAVLDKVEERTGRRPRGPVRMLTHLRYFGVCFNPVTFYYCFGADGALAAVLAEITNTPWGERHHYVVGATPGAGVLRGALRKEFHVSPFQPMAQDYRWTLSPPGERLAVHMVNRADGRPVFDATLALRRAPWTGATLARAFLRHPWPSAKVSLLIYWHALRLWWKRAPFFTHPAKATT